MYLFTSKLEAFHSEPRKRKSNIFEAGSIWPENRKNQNFVNHVRTCEKSRQHRRVCHQAGFLRVSNKSEQSWNGGVIF
jgi:hypothetical protein